MRFDGRYSRVLKWFGHVHSVHAGLTGMRQSLAFLQGVSLDPRITKGHRWT